MHMSTHFAYPIRRLSVRNHRAASKPTAKYNFVVFVENTIRIQSTFCILTRPIGFGNVVEYKVMGAALHACNRCCCSRYPSSFL